MQITSFLKGAILKKYLKITLLVSVLILVLSFISIKSEDFKVFVFKTYFYLVPNKLEENLIKTSLNLTENNEMKEELKFWLKVAGIEKNVEAFKFISKNQTLPMCHKNAHVLGTKSYEVYKSEAFFHYSDWCSSGFIHGIMEAYLKENGFEFEKIKKICTDLKIPIKIGECIHGVGHGLLSFENYDLPNAIKDCQSLKLSDLYSSACLDGVFMENKIASSGGSNSIHKTSWVSDDPLFPCNAVDNSDIVQNACFTNQVPILLDLYKKDLTKVSEICQSVKDKKSQDTCFYGMGLQIPLIIKSSDPQKLFDECSHTKDNSGSCLRGILKYLVKAFDQDLKDQGVKLCNLISNQNSKKNCYQNFGRFLKLQYSNNPEFIKSICAFSEKEYESFCLGVN